MSGDDYYSPVGYRRTRGGSPFRRGFAAGALVGALLCALWVALDLAGLL